MRIRKRKSRGCLRFPTVLAAFRPSQWKNCITVLFQSRVACCSLKLLVMAQVRWIFTFYFRSSPAQARGRDFAQALIAGKNRLILWTEKATERCSGNL